MNNFVALAKSVVHLEQKFRVNEIVGVENRHGVINLPVPFHVEQSLEHPFQREAFGLFGFVDALADDCSGGSGNFGGVVGTVVGNNENVVKFVGVVKRFKIFNERGDNRAFVVRRDYDGEFFLRRRNFFLRTSPHAAKTD